MQMTPTNTLTIPVPQVHVDALEALWTLPQEELQEEVRYRIGDFTTVLREGTLTSPGEIFDLMGSLAVDTYLILEPPRGHAWYAQSLRKEEGAYIAECARWTGTEVHNYAFTREDGALLGLAAAAGILAHFVRTKTLPDWCPKAKTVY